MPKKKGGKKGAKIIDGIATNEMSREQLMGHVKRMQLELEREREERNFFMLEREKLFSLWNLTLEQLTREKETARLTEENMCENEKEKQQEVNVYKQKLRYLMTEQSKKVGEVRLQNLKKMKSVQDDMWRVQETMRESVVGKTKELQKVQTSFHEMMRHLKLENTRNVSELRKDLCAEIRRLESEYDRRMFERNQDQAAVHNDELLQLSVAKSEQIHELIQTHENQLKEMKSFFNEITVNNFAVITALQQEIQEMKEAEERLHQELAKSRKEYKILQSQLIKENDEKTAHRVEDRKSADHIRKELEKVGKRLAANDRHTRIMEASNEALLQKIQLVEKERNSLKSTFAKAIVEMQKKSSMKRLILEMKLTAASRKQQEDTPNSRTPDTTSNIINRQNKSSDEDEDTQSSGLLQKVETHGSILKKTNEDENHVATRLGD